MSVRYSLVVTSCNRFDLLDETLASFQATADVAPAQVIVTEDSGKAEVGNVVRRYFADAEVIVNVPQLGQMRSIDLAYSKVTNDYIFHCEDDWLFFRRGFISESAALLAADQRISMVILRARSDLNPLVRKLPRKIVGGVACFLYDPSLHPEHFSYSFNPGLRRLSDARKLGPFAPIGSEDDVSFHFKKAGYYMAALDEPAVRHLGHDRHVDDPMQRKRATNLFERWSRSIYKRVKRVRRSLARP
ncbi:MAG: glycosyltransferase [Hyphomicrobium sp.]|jgi:hypothetical protein